MKKQKYLEEILSHRKKNKLIIDNRGEEESRVKNRKEENRKEKKRKEKQREEKRRE